MFGAKNSYDNPNDVPDNINYILCGERLTPEKKTRIMEGFFQSKTKMGLKKAKSTVEAIYGGRAYVSPCPKS